jgi:GT2 family glycosyltransferase
MEFTVAVCTRDRPAMLKTTLEALAGQDDPDFAVLVVDQSARPGEGCEDLLRRAGWTLRHDQGQGLSRARNIAWRASTTEWIVFLDDDVVPDPGWSAGLRRAVDARPGPSIVMADTPAGGTPGGDLELAVTAFPIEREDVRQGRWLNPWEIGFTLNQGFRRSALERVGGFDERLGAGGKPFQSADDMDLNYRLLRAGESALLTPAARAHHLQWRGPEDLVGHYEGYMHGWCGFAMKQLRTGDVAGGLWLWALGLEDLLRMAASAVRRRSLLRLRIAGGELRGFVAGTARGLACRW